MSKCLNCNFWEESDLAEAHEKGLCFDCILDFRKARKELSNNE